ncbi:MULTISPECIES: DUF1870 family protein [unclassified Leclercia]|uniref:DUF1870 family protein n=1 Tax=Leclercia barmai TaxID=2785629 RepID=A0ABS7RWM7_9ENTR|nr:MULTISPECIES: DUF1870 family protein [unclassified Leclercia]MBZ0058707.1 DUF1870 family protein [Leclercia sp. EMC7]MCM5696117.1 YdiL family protein [Leclercia sp. LTM01]MCM5702364.1 YdiL family protein [Leclercia sp. LTM14]
MNRLALIACRRILFLEVEEAATHIAEVSQRTWRYYESGRTQIPGHLAEKIEKLLQYHTVMKDRMSKEADEYRQKGEGRQAVPYYLTFEDYQKETGLDDVIAFRLDQSVKAALYLEDKVVFY